MKPFYKIVENNLISGFGSNGPDTMTEITEAEYSELVTMFHNRPTAPDGYGYVLQDEPREWVLVELPPAPENEEISPEEVMDIYPPGGPGTEALYEEVAAPGKGESKDNPIEYNRNMALELGKFYVDVPAGDGVVYVCTRDSGVALVHPLAQMVGHYVEVAA